MILLKGKALAKDKWITVTKFSRKPQPSISQVPPSTNQYAILADAASTPALQQACPVLDHKTGKTLKHRQFRRDPQLKKT
jgi:hypothetical protein